MRGKANILRRILEESRITPAHAGKRTLISQFPLVHKDHPRTCGEKSLFFVIVRRIIGSPPHMRGKAYICYTLCSGYRITPAHAGKRQCQLLRYLPAEDHPRTCGEKNSKGKDFICYAGSPPHMRGKVFARRGGLVMGRITPAHAGKSAFKVAGGFFVQDHPRTCGEKWWT